MSGDNNNQMNPGGGGLDSGDNNANELTALVQQMLTQMQNRFQTMSENIIGRIDEMGSRIDDLEKSIADLVQEAQNDSEGAGRDVQRMGGVPGGASR